MLFESLAARVRVILIYFQCMLNLLCDKIWFFFIFTKHMYTSVSICHFRFRSTFLDRLKLFINLYSATCRIVDFFWLIDLIVFYALSAVNILMYDLFHAFLKGTLFSYFEQFYVVLYSKTFSCMQNVYNLCMCFIIV